MSKFGRSKNLQNPSSSSTKSTDIIKVEIDNRNKWQGAYYMHMKQNGGGKLSNKQSSIITPRIADITNTVVKNKLQGELRGMLFNSKKVNSGLGYSIIILVANIIFILIGTFVFVHIEGTAERIEHEEDYEKKLHLIEHISNSEKVLPSLLSLQMEMCEKGNSRAGEKSWEYTGSLHYCLTILSTIGYGVTSPHGYLSKAVSVVYAMLGIPIYAVYLSYAYLAISNVLDAFCNLVFTCLRKNPGDVVRLFTKLFLANLILWSYLLILIFLWTPIQKKPHKHPKIHRGDDSEQQKSIVDEIYWQVIRFTSVGFGDEFRDVSEQPSHIPSVVNVLCVGFFLLPFGISVTSFFFQMYRKVFGKPRKWFDIKCRKIQRKTMTKVKTLRPINGVIKVKESQNTRSSNVCRDTNLISITEASADAVS
ncbi:potassium channel subfamily K member 16-like isoform X3 [Bolinopsis microptera]|uniref:potassium channel subfamily K member 16-like isoform X3 n=1 Tax=Bolinopsis microptera TaxID=2820187 RepID=UPI00307AF651